jgi:hypothetical protein
MGSDMVGDRYGGLDRAIFPGIGDASAAEPRAAAVAGQT